MPKGMKAEAARRLLRLHKGFPTKGGGESRYPHEGYTPRHAQKYQEGNYTDTTRQNIAYSSVVSPERKEEEERRERAPDLPMNKRRRVIEDRIEAERSQGIKRSNYGRMR